MTSSLASASNSRIRNRRRRQADSSLTIASSVAETTRSSISVAQDDVWEGHDALHLNDGNHTQSSIAVGPPHRDEWLLHGDSSPQHASSLNGTIPKAIYKVYLQRDGLFPSKGEMKAMPATLREAHGSWSDQNPGYEVRYFNLNQCRLYLTEKYHPIFLRAFDCLESFAAKADFFRLALIYADGGWYSDWKQTCLKDNLLDRLGEDADFFGAYDYGEDWLREEKTCVTNSFFGAVPRHAVLAEAIQMFLGNIQQEQYDRNVIFTTGPCLFGRAIHKYVGEQSRSIQGRLRLGAYHMSMETKEHGHISQIWENTDQTEPPMILNKCLGCGQTQSWTMGNDYNKKFEEHDFYCEDARSLFYSSPQYATDIIFTREEDVIQTSEEYAFHIHLFVKWFSLSVLLLLLQLHVLKHRKWQSASLPRYLNNIKLHNF